MPFLFKSRLVQQKHAVSFVQQMNFLQTSVLSSRSVYTQHTLRPPSTAAAVNTGIFRRPVRRYPSIATPGRPQDTFLHTMTFHAQSMLNAYSQNERRLQRNLEPLSKNQRKALCTVLINCKDALRKEELALLCV